MKIDWFTVIAQIINFLILVWLLKRYLYKPILNAIDEREKKIAAQLQNAETKKVDAKKEQDDFRKKNEDFDQQKKMLMDKAIEETNEERQKLLDTAKKEADVLRTNLQKAAEEEQQKQNDELTQKIKKEVLVIAKKTLSDIASISLEAQSVNMFIKRLKELAADDKKQFTDAFQSNSNTILVRSAFDLSPEQQSEVNKAVNDLLGIKVQLQFKTTPELISGIELTTNGYKQAWSISEYLNSLEKSISETMKTDGLGEPEKQQHAIT